ncbi:MAG: hypothetical protein R2733_22740 [Acidimicrobiales bacterium]
MIDPTVLAQSASPLGDGKIDNWIISSSVHVVVGSLVLLTMTVATGWVGWLAIKGRSLDLGGKILISVAQVVLALQVLIGIKLLDQGQGIVQLYIHYLGGLLPMGAFLAGGWWVRGETPTSNRLLAALIAIGWFSAVMAFTIGRQYANG